MYDFTGIVWMTSLDNSDKVTYVLLFVVLSRDGDREATDCNFKFIDIGKANLVDKSIYQIIYGYRG